MTTYRMCRKSLVAYYCRCYSFGSHEQRFWFYINNCRCVVTFTIDFNDYPILSYWLDKTGKADFVYFWKIQLPGESKTALKTALKYIPV